jgi:hypothetical protein
MKRTLEEVTDAIIKKNTSKSGVTNFGKILLQNKTKSKMVISSIIEKAKEKNFTNWNYEVILSSNASPTLIDLFTKEAKKNNITIVK